MPAWTDTADKEMLLNFITVTAPTVSKGTNQTVADMMGEGYTSESVRQRLAKLRKQITAAPGSTAASADGTPPAPKTPAKKTPKKKAAGEGAGSKRKASAVKDVSAAHGVDEDDEEGGSPSKKAKMVKEEVTDDMD